MKKVKIKMSPIKFFDWISNPDVIEFRKMLKRQQYYEYNSDMPNFDYAKFVGMTKSMGFVFELYYNESKERKSEQFIVYYDDIAGKLKIE